MADTDTSSLADAVLRWANDAAGQALDSLGQRARDRAPYGTSDDPRKDGPHLVDTLEVVVTSEGEQWSGEIAFTADYASYVDEGRGPIDAGEGFLYFYWEGHLISVHSVGPQEANPFFSDTVNDEGWADELERALDATSVD